MAGEWEGGRFHLPPQTTAKLFTFIPLKVPTKAVYLPGVGAKKDGCEKKFLKLVQKRRNAKRGVGAKKKIFERSAPATTFVKS